ncbi:MAG: hypothetical protein Q4G49_03040 [Paracoccus sp. (in: a-proteobacteria)]|nr:hypothetical protein [Paracoccus sp. (in: a-proteobacteria)]
MALSFPLSLHDFWLKLPIRRLQFDCPGVTTHARTRGGEILPAEIGTRLWTAQVELGDMTADEWDEVDALLIALNAGGASFLATDTRRPMPAADPTGAGLAGSNPAISSSPNVNDLTLSGLPPQYALRRGDMLSFSYGGNPVRRALHKVVTGGVADLAGNLTLTITPPRESAAPNGTAVRLIRPVCKMLIVPDSIEPGFGRAGGIHTGVTFSCQQTLR